MKKTSLLTLLCLCAVTASRAQFFKSVLPSTSFADSVSLVVQDFKRDYSTIQGKQLPSQGEADVFLSRVTVPGASHCSIIRFHSRLDTTASWQAIMYQGESYETAVKVYKNTFRELKKTKMKWADKSIVYFEGDMEKPVENLRFAVTSMNLSIEERPYRNFFAEIELTYNTDGWEVHLNLHKKKSDAEQY